MLIISTTTIKDCEHFDNAFRFLISKNCDITLWSAHEIPEELLKFDFTVLGPCVKSISLPNNAVLEVEHAINQPSKITPLQLIRRVRNKIYREARKLYRRSNAIRFVKGIVIRGRLWRRVNKDLTMVNAYVDGVLAADRNAVFVAWRVAKRFDSPLALSNLQAIEPYYAEIFPDA
jgi:hypothetical protein